jgi:hypothetical protein
MTAIMMMTMTMMMMTKMTNGNNSTEHDKIIKLKDNNPNDDYNDDVKNTKKDNDEVSVGVMMTMMIQQR